MHRKEKPISSSDGSAETSASCELSASASHRRTASASSHFSSTHISSETLDKGQSLSKPSFNLMQGLSATWSGKGLKSPRPERAQMMFNAVIRGLRECIELAQNDVSNLRATIDNISVASSCQIKAAERYLKKLEFHFSKLEELKEKYDVQQKIREGIRSMACAYVLSQGKERCSALHNVQAEYKECNHLLCSFESKLEELMGALLFEMKGIQGFARMCHGDVFEITVKHGDQKWKSRGHIFKDNKQSWENKRILFKSLFNDPLYIKAVEVRGLGKNILLGNKYCETVELFSAHPQQMTINLNASGSLKLNLVITWNPLHNIIDDTSVQCKSSAIGFESPFCNKWIPQVIQDPNVKNMASTTSEMVNYKSSLPSSKTSESDLKSTRSDTSTFNQNSDKIIPNAAISVEAYDENSTQNTETLSFDLEPLSDPNFTKLKISNSSVQSDSNMVELVSPSEISSCSDVNMKNTDFNDVNNSLMNIKSLSSALECAYIQYPDLEELYKMVVEVEGLLKPQKKSTSDSDISISIESVLGCFDFLNTAIDDDLDCSDDRLSKSEYETSVSSPLVEEDNKELMQQNQDSSSICDMEQLDLAIKTHVQYCLRLLKFLGSSSPMKCREILSLDKLRKQKPCFATIKNLLHLEDDKNDVNEIVFQGDEKNLKHLWTQLVGANLCSSVASVIPKLDDAVKFMLADSEVDQASKVSSKLLCQMLDIKKIHSDSLITAMQFKLFFTGYNLPLSHIIRKIATEVYIYENIQSKNKLKIEAGFHEFKKINPTSDILFAISHMLFEDNFNLKSIAECYLTNVSKDFSVKMKVITSYLEGLESEDWEIRRSSCAALGIMNASDYTEQIAYLCFADASPEVQQAAKATLMSFGVEGRKWFEGYENLKLNL